MVRDRFRLPAKCVLFIESANEVEEERFDGDEGFVARSIVRQWLSLRQLRRRRRRGVLIVVTEVIRTLGQRTSLPDRSALSTDGAVGGMIGFLNGRRRRWISSVCEAESDSDAAAKEDDCVSTIESRWAWSRLV